MATPAAAGFSLAQSHKRRGEAVVKGALALCALVSVATTVGIVAALFLPAFEFFQTVNFVDYITGTEWAPLFLQKSFGVVPLIVGTLSVTFWACLVAIPLGLGSAIYLSEYARPRVRKTLKPALGLLAGIPTVVYGYFALTFVTPHLRDIGIQVSVFNALSAGLVMGVMIIPTVASLSEDAMTAVPSDLRDGAYALGSSRVCRYGVTRQEATSLSYSSFSGCAGRAAFHRGQGQINLSCSQCHDDLWGRKLAGSVIPQAHPTGYPIYRLEWQSLGSLQRRLRNCLIGTRAEAYEFGAPELVDLELYLMWRAQGMKLESPGVRP